MKINRRDFFKMTGQSAIILAVPAIAGTLLESCNNNLTNPTANSAALANINGTYANGIVKVTIDSSSPISKTGTAAMVNFQNSQILVDHPSGNSFNALSAVCTHQGCLITNYDSGSSQFVCPCHGSHYDVNGNVVSGPAPSALQKFQAQFASNVLTINVG